MTRAGHRGDWQAGICSSSLHKLFELSGAAGTMRMGAWGCAVGALCSGPMFQVVDSVMGKNNELNELNELREDEFVSVRLSSLFFFSVFDKAKRCMQQACFHKERRRDGRCGRGRVLKSGSLSKRVGEALYGLIRPAPGIR